MLFWSLGFFFFQLSLCFMEGKKRLEMLVVQRRNQADNKRENNVWKSRAIIKRKAARYFEIDLFLSKKKKKYSKYNSIHTCEVKTCDDIIPAEGLNQPSD